MSLVSMRYLGRMISAEGYKPDLAETKALDKFRIPPQTNGDLRSLRRIFGLLSSLCGRFCHENEAHV